MMIRYGGEEGGGIGGGGTMNCQDCGNQAKKDCPHMRCRTCCKSQGFHCETHVKSTWVPAARRLQKQQQLTIEGGRGGGDNNYSKRPRDSNNPAAASSSLVSTRLVSSSSGLDMSGNNFPPEFNSSAVFSCVRVSPAADQEEEQYAYQTAVNIGGRVFKGILYDQGPDSIPFSAIGGGGSTLGGSSGGVHHHFPLDHIATAATTTAATTTTVYPYAYSTPQNAFMAGTQFFPPPRP